jgi:glycosyltransferase involved in cell wall biosynthesis
MRYSIITPTLLRPTLNRLIETIDSQTNTDWEHIIMVDRPLVFDKEAQRIVESLSGHEQRHFVRCGKAHKDFGNSCRWNAWDRATGDYILYIDDDDYYADERVLETLTEVYEPWAIFPCVRYGSYYLAEPPGLNRTGSNMFMHKREIGRYPCAAHCAEHTEIIDRLKKEHPNSYNMYAADGMLVEYLKARYPYQVVQGRPLTIYEQANQGKQ